MGERVGDRIAALARRVGAKLDIVREMPTHIWFLLKTPPDVDDSMLWIELRARILQAGAKLPQSVAAVRREPAIAWGKFAELVVSSAYAPFDPPSSPRAVIDPRTYFWVRGFLEREQAAGRKPLLATTWMTNIVTDRQRKYENMVFGTNNIDVTEAANTLAGIAAVVTGRLTAPQPLSVFLTPDLTQLAVDTARMVAWSMTSGITQRRLDIVPIYYPHFAFFVYASARAAAGESEAPERFGEAPQLAAALRELGAAVRGAGTRQLLGEAETLRDGTMAWHSALGTADSLLGFSVGRGDDYIWSTGVAVDALSLTWSRRAPRGSASCARKWLPETPARVKTAVEQGLRFLVKQTQRSTYEWESLFFSSDFKGRSIVPMAFPGNVAEFVNGTKYTRPVSEPVPLPLLPETFAQLSFGVRGFVPPAQYEEMLRQPWFGQRAHRVNRPRAHPVPLLDLLGRHPQHRRPRAPAGIKHLLNNKSFLLTPLSTRLFAASFTNFSFVGEGRSKMNPQELERGVAELMRQFGGGRGAAGLDRDVLVSVLEMHNGNVQVSPPECPRRQNVFSRVFLWLRKKRDSCLTRSDAANGGLPASRRGADGGPRAGARRPAAGLHDQAAELGAAQGLQERRGPGVAGGGVPGAQGAADEQRDAVPAAV